ncbi:MAG: ABC transporter ATP-binding protein [Ottowia sp.]|nr:ABC transporter ATP-binding protein [Ottowia sp.]
MNAILEARNLNKRFGAIVAAEDVSVAIAADAVVGLIGANGAGKTTFVNMVTGYLKPDSGQIALEGNDITTLRPRQITRRGICRSFQIPQLYDTMTVRENLEIGLGILWLNRRRMAAESPAAAGAGKAASLDAAAQDILEQFHLAAHRDRIAGELPEGLRKLLDIAMALIARPRILLLDEPTSGVSADEKFDIMDRVMTAVHAQGVTVLFVEHDMDIVRRYSQRVLAFYQGRILADGSVRDVLADEDVRRHVTGA